MGGGKLKRVVLAAAARGELLAGVRDQVPLLAGVVPVGMIFGAFAVERGLPPLAVQGLSLLLFAGSAQFAAVGLIAAGSGPLIVILTILVVNLRHLLYSAALAPLLQPLSVRWRLALAWLLTDESFAITSLRYGVANAANAHWYAMGTGLALWTSWQAATALGIRLGALLPDSWGLDFAMPLTFVALLLPTLRVRSMWAAAAGAGFLAVALDGLPYKLGLLLAIGAGSAIGLLAEQLAAHGTVRESGQGA